MTINAGSTRDAGSAAARIGKPVRAAGVDAVLALAAIGADQAFDPVRTHVPLCPLHAMTGLWCPFCGGLRAIYELTRLNITSAVRDNIVVVIGLPIFALLWLEGIIRARAGRPRRILPRPLVITIIVALAVFSIVRNLPFASMLHPGS
jgi:hypothetical protein